MNDIGGYRGVTTRPSEPSRISIRISEYSLTIFAPTPMLLAIGVAHQLPGAYSDRVEEAEKGLTLRVSPFGNLRLSTAQVMNATSC